MESLPTDQKQINDGMLGSVEAMCENYNDVNEEEIMANTKKADILMMDQEIESD